MLKNLLKAAVGVATAPVDVAADLITMGGALTDEEEPYTVKKVKEIKKNLDDASDPDNEDW